MKATPLLLAVLLAFGIAAPSLARAHDIFEITGNAQIETDEIVLQVVMARGTARAAVAREGATTPAFDATNFAEVRGLLEARAGQVVALTTHGETLVASEVQASLTSEEDVEFLFVYPRPTRGPLSFDALCLKKMPQEGYGVNLTVLESTSRGAQLLASTMLMAENPTLEINWPSSSVPAPVARHVAEATPARLPWLLWFLAPLAVAAGGLLLVALSRAQARRVA